MAGANAARSTRTSCLSPYRRRPSTRPRHAGRGRLGIRHPGAGMKITTARLALVLATRSLGARHDAWAQAMSIEFEEAVKDGRELSFAIGCLTGAWRMMPAHAEGRFLLSSHALAIGLLVPMAAMLALAALFGFPFVAATTGIDGYLSGSGEHLLLLNAGSRGIAPSLTLLVLLMAACHLLLAWWVLDRDWDRIGIAVRSAAALTTTLTIMTCCAALDPTRLLSPIAVMSLELAAVAALTKWHDRVIGSQEVEHFEPAY